MCATETNAPSPSPRRLVHEKSLSVVRLFCRIVDRRQRRSLVFALLDQWRLGSLCWRVAGLRHGADRGSWLLFGAAPDGACSRSQSPGNGTQQLYPFYPGPTAALKRRLLARIKPCRMNWTHQVEIMRSRQTFGQIALRYGEDLPIEVLGADQGFYIGTRKEDLPFSRESAEYFATRAQAQQALATGSWTQRECSYCGATAVVTLLTVSRRSADQRKLAFSQCVASSL